MSRLNVVKLPRQVRGVAAWDAGSPIVATAYDGEGFDATAVCALDLTGRLLWQQCFDGRPHQPRLSDVGTAWIAHRGAQGAMATELNSAGSIVRTIWLDSDPSEELGELVVLPDGIMVLWLPARRSHVIPRGSHARLARHDEDGGTRWSTPLTLKELSFPGVVEISRHTGGKIAPSPPWTPRTVEPSHWNPLLVSGSRVAATISCGSSGIAVTFFVETDTGQLIGTTVPGPTHQKAIVGSGEFLIGSQGYGAFSTAHYDANGAVTRQWPTHAQMLIDVTGVISGPESQNTSLPQWFVRFGADGAVRHGPALSGYHTTYPALDGDGTAVFWRDGALRAVDVDLRMRELLRSRHTGSSSRVLLLEGGHAVFASNDELIIFREPGLRPLNDGIWPCGDGGLRGNPVKFHQSS